MPGGLTSQSDITRAEAIQTSFCNNNMTRAEAQRRLYSISVNVVTSYWLTCDTVYVPPIGPPVVPGDFDGDGIPNEQDPDHYLPDLDNDGQADIFDVRDVGNGGIESGGRARLLNVAGYWTLGVAQGTLFMLVPMVMVGLSVGFMQRVVKLGAKVGGE